MKIAIMSDSHDNWPKVKQAVQLANQAGCQVLLHAGDLIAPPGIDILKNFKGDVYYVWGNNEGEKIGAKNLIDKYSNVQLMGETMDQQLGGLKVFMNHYPHLAKLAVKSGDYDLIVCGHSHDYVVKQFSRSMFINPGELGGYKTGVSSLVIFDTETHKAEKKEV